MSTSYELEKISGPVSLKDRAYAVIKNAILSLKLKPGAPLVETQLADELGISKTPVRAALEELESRLNTVLTRTGPRDLLVVSSQLPPRQLVKLQAALRRIDPVPGRRIVTTRRETVRRARRNMQLAKTIPISKAGRKPWIPSWRMSAVTSTLPLHRKVLKPICSSCGP